MGEAEFHRYWVDTHAACYASKIPQIRKYLVNTRIPMPGEDGQPPWSGVAEIWLANEEEQLASLQSREFLEGARADEPNWAAFWQTVVLDTDAHEIIAGPDLVRDPTWVKLIILVKRREGLSLARFRERSLTTHASLASGMPGLRRYLQCHTRDASYGVGEAVLDAAYQLWFDDADALADARRSAEFERVYADIQAFAEPRYIHQIATAEKWIIGPECR